MKYIFIKILVILYPLIFGSSCTEYKYEKLKAQTVLSSQSSTVSPSTSASGNSSNTQDSVRAYYTGRKLVLGVARYKEYLPLINNKNIAVFINHTSLLNGLFLHEALLKQGMYVKKVFTPEHGLTASADAGAKVNSKIDAVTGLPIKSLYGNAKKPTSIDLAGIDVVIFDMQDVGCRFYTYISSLQYMMEACAKNNKKLIVLDRPNPNGHYVDGPVLQEGFQSFVGMQKIPIVHGMTVGEYALMLKGEKWIEGAADLDMTIVPCDNYSHQDFYSIPVFPSPNLRNDDAIELYPALCLFEGTDVSIGRGTDFPFEVYGSPIINGLKFSFSFVPRSGFGASNPPHMDQVCNGMDLRMKLNGKQRFHEIPLQYLIDAYFSYRSMGKQSKFFNPFFKKLAGNDLLQSQIEKGMTEDEIRLTWQKDLNQFKSIRKKYLLYPD